VKIKKYTLLISAVSMAFSWGCVEINQTDNAPVSSERISGKYIENDVLYTTLTEVFEKGETEVEFDGFVDSDDLSDVLDDVKRDYPEYFWLDCMNVYSVETSKNSSSCDFESMNDYTSEELMTMVGEIRAAGDKIISGMPEGLDDYGKALYVHDYIAEHTVYDDSKVGIEEKNLWDTAYGCLVEGKAVCGGYSRGFQYIMNQLDIPCGVVNGKAWNRDPTSREEYSEPAGHAWNYISLNGINYWVDVTWDDAGDTENMGTDVFHTYFLLNDERLICTHSIGENQKNIPACYSMDSNYHVKNGSYLNKYSPEAVGAVMANSAYSGFAEMMFADEQTYKNAVKGLFENGELWNLYGYVQFGESVSYVLDDDMHVIIICY